MTLPVRMSVFDDDYDPLAHPQIRVMLDGIEQRDVTGYDIEAGVVTRCQRDDADKRIIEPLTGCPLLEKVRGKVEVMDQPAVRPVAG